MTLKILQDAETMPVEIRHYPDRGLRHVRYAGQMSVADVQSVTKQVFDHAVELPCPYCFLDMENVTEVEVDFSHLFATKAQADRFMIRTQSMLRMSCHAPTDLGFGMARIYHSLIEDRPWAESFVSRDREEAKAWLGLGALPFE